MKMYLDADRDDSVFPEIGSEVTSDGLEISGNEHLGVNPWENPLWAPAQVKDITGIHIPGDAEEISIEEFRTVVQINLFGQFYCAKYAIPYLRKTEGSIINIGSIHAIDGGAGPPYASAKAGVVNLTKDLATAFDPDNINANAVCPGYVKTPMQDYLTEADIEASRQQTTLPRFGEPRDIGNAVAFLVSDEAEWITGTPLFVDGGWTAIGETIKR